MLAARLIRRSSRSVGALMRHAVAGAKTNGLVSIALSRARLGGSLGSTSQFSTMQPKRPVLDIYKYPRKGYNTILNTCPQGAVMVIERFGKFLRMERPGLFFAIPLVDRIRFVHDLREIPIVVSRQEAISKDNVTVQLDGTVYAQVVDPHLASYGINKPLYAVVQHAQSAMRAAVGLMDLDELFHARARLNAEVARSIESASLAWGVKVLRFEISEITPDSRIRAAMDLQAVAERERREEVLKSEASKRAMELRSEGKRLSDVNESEGVRVRMINESEGARVRLTNEGEGDKQRIIKAAEAEAQAILSRAAATAGGLTMIARALAEPHGDRALAAHLAREYFGAFSDLAKGSSTLVIPQNVADVSGMVASAMAVVDRVHLATRAAAAASQESPRGALGEGAGIGDGVKKTGEMQRTTVDGAVSGAQTQATAGTLGVGAGAVDNAVKA